MTITLKYDSDFLNDFLFFLRTNTHLQPISLRRTVGIVRRLLDENYLTDKTTFQRYCLKRLDEGIDPETINKDVAAIKKYLMFTNQDWGQLNYFKTKRKSQPSPTYDEIQHFLSVDTTPAANVYWHIHIYSGTRPSEVLNLKLKDIDFNNDCFYPEQTKTNDGKPIILLPNVKTILQDYIKTLDAPINLLFPSMYDHNRPMTIAAIENDCRKRLKIMGCNMPYTPHSFRHAYITIGIANGVPVQYIQRTARHSDIKTTMGYFDKSVDFAKKAAYAHPYYKDQLSIDELIADWIAYISKTADNRFNKSKLQEIFALFYQAINV